MRDVHSKAGILAQNTTSPERKLGLRWLLAISTIPLFGIYAAFGIAPQTVTQDIPVTTVIEEVALPAMNNANATPVAENFWQIDQIRRDDTFDSLMSRLNINNQQAIDFLRYDASAKAFATGLRPGGAIQAQTTEEGELLRLQYKISQSSILHVEQTETGYKAYTAEA